MTLTLSWKKIVLICGGITTILGCLVYLFTLGQSTYRTVVGLHSNYATQSQLIRVYFQTRVDDMNGEIVVLNSRRSFYEAKRTLSGELDRADSLRLDETLAELSLKTNQLKEFRLAICKTGEDAIELAQCN